MTILKYNNFFSEGVIAFTTDKYEDFFLGSDDKGLNNSQKKYLADIISMDLPEVANIRQVHGKKIIVADKEYIQKGVVEEADSLITNKKKLPIMIRTADCVPIFLYDKITNSIGIVHAGWKGSKQDIGAETIKTMNHNYGASPENIRVAFGPSILKCCYEVDKEFLEYFPDYIEERDGKLFLDLQEYNKKRLLDAGIMESNIFNCEECTCCNNNYFSFRRGDTHSGRMASFIMLL